MLLLLAYCGVVAFHPQAREWATSEEGPTPFKFVNTTLALPARLIGPTQNIVVNSDARVASFPPSVTPSGPTSARSVATTPGNEATNPVSFESSLAGDPQPPAETQSSETAAGQPAAAEATAAAGPAELKLPGGVVIANRSTSGTPAASASFMYWAASLTVSGVTSTSPARFLMNGRLVREGDEASRQLGITFERVDAAAKLLYFRDKSGAIVTRSY